MGDASMNPTSYLAAAVIAAVFSADVLRKSRVPFSSQVKRTAMLEEKQQLR